MNFDVLLWDVDGTLLDFLAAEKAAIKKLFHEFGLGECTDAMIARYSEINKHYWEALERGDLTKPVILVRRFADFFAEYGIDTSVAEAFNELYQIRLGDTVVFCDDSYNILASLRGRVKQYAVSNGTIAAQELKLRNSGLSKLFDGVFLSERLGCEKPAPGFFERVFEAIGPVDKERVLIIGDSLTSDIAGGNNAGIKTCWYNPKSVENGAGAHVDYEIRDLHEVPELL